MRGSIGVPLVPITTGGYRRAYVLDRRGDRIVARVERRLHWAQDRRAARFPRG